MAENKTDEIMITRIFDAPVERIWEAWTEPEEIMKWWGPKDFTSPTCEIDFRVGGKYIFCMRAPEEFAKQIGKRDMYSTGTYKEIVPRSKIVATDSFSDAQGHIVSGSEYGMPADFPRELTFTITFEAQDGKTKMNLLHEGLPAGDMAEQTKAGWNESLDKLAESLK